MRSPTPHAASSAFADEQGFSMVELLVVTLVIGILAAIALAAFTGQAKKGQDASAKNNARVLVGAIEACHVSHNDYSDCDTEAKLAADQQSGLSAPFGAGAGHVEVNNAQPKSYDAVAHSTSGNDFTISRDDTGTLTRTCVTAGTAGCPSGGSW